VALEVEELLGVDLGDRRRVRAAHVVGEDLQAGDRVGVRALGQQQVARLLERVGLLGAAVDLDHAAPDRGGAAVEDPAEGQVARGARRGVLLQRVEVDVLAPARGVGAGDRGVRAALGELRLEEDLAVLAAEAERDPVQVAVAADDRPLRAEHPGLLVDVLAAHVAQPRVVAHDELDDPVDQARACCRRPTASGPRPRPARPPRARRACACAGRSPPRRGCS
jgi:hypothetical protein